MSDHEVCPTCGRPMDITRICSDCGGAFSISPSQERFFLRKGLELPRRCQRCLDQRRKWKQGADGPEPEVLDGHTER
jgi:hypothetical protein